MNNKHQESHWYKDYQIGFYPIEQALRCENTYSQQVMVWAPDRTVVYERYFNTDEIFWSGVETQEKMLDYVKRVIDGGIHE